MVRTQRGTLELSSPAERTSFIRVEGHMQAEHARAIVDFGKAVERALAERIRAR